MAKEIRLKGGDASVNVASAEHVTVNIGAGVGGRRVAFARTDGSVKGPNSTTTYPYARSLARCVAFAKLIGGYDEGATIGRIVADSKGRLKPLSVRKSVRDSRIFGLIEMRNGTIRVSGLGYRCITEENPKGRAIALAESFATVELYRDVIENYDGTMERNDQALRTFLGDNDRVAKGMTQDAINILISSARYSGWLKPGATTLRDPRLEESRDTASGMATEPQALAAPEAEAIVAEEAAEAPVAPVAPEPEAAPKPEPEPTPAQEPADKPAHNKPADGFAPGPSKEEPCRRFGDASGSDGRMRILVEMLPKRVEDWTLDQISAWIAVWHDMMRLEKLCNPR